MSSVHTFDFVGALVVIVGGYSFFVSQLLNVRPADPHVAVETSEKILRWALFL